MCSGARRTTSPAGPRTPSVNVYSSRSSSQVSSSASPPRRRYHSRHSAIVSPRRARSSSPSAGWSAALIRLRLRSGEGRAVDGPAGEKHGRRATGRADLDAVRRVGQWERGPQRVDGRRESAVAQQPHQPTAGAGGRVRWAEPKSGSGVVSASASSGLPDGKGTGRAVVARCSEGRERSAAAADCGRRPAGPRRRRGTRPPATAWPASTPGRRSSPRRRP